MRSGMSFNYHSVVKSFYFYPVFEFHDGFLLLTIHLWPLRKCSEHFMFLPTSECYLYIRNCRFLHNSLETHWQEWIKLNCLSLGWQVGLKSSLPGAEVIVISLSERQKETVLQISNTRYKIKSNTNGFFPFLKFIALTKLAGNDIFWMAYCTYSCISLKFNLIIIALGRNTFRFIGKHISPTFLCPKIKQRIKI